MPGGWREVVERAGGAQRAMLYGSALTQLLDERSRLEIEAGKRLLDDAHLESLVAAAESVARGAVAKLELEREALREATEQLLVLRERVKAMGRVVEMVRRERERSVVSNALDSVLVDYDEAMSGVA